MIIVLHSSFPPFISPHEFPREVFIGSDLLWRQHNSLSLTAELMCFSEVYSPAQTFSVGEVFTRPKSC